MECKFVLRHGFSKDSYCLYDDHHLLFHIQRTKYEMFFRHSEGDQVALQLTIPRSFFGKEVIEVKHEFQGNIYFSEIIKFYTIFYATQKLDIYQLGSKHFNATLKVGLLKTVLLVDGIEVGKIEGRSGDDLYRLSVNTDKELSLEDYLFLNALCFFNYFVFNIRSID